MADVNITPELLKVLTDRLGKLMTRMKVDRVFEAKMKSYVGKRSQIELANRVVLEKPTIVSIAFEPTHQLVSVQVTDALEVASVDITLRQGQSLLTKGAAEKLSDGTLWVYRWPRKAKGRLTIEATATNVFGNTAKRMLKPGARAGKALGA
jgi:hypothetical protein